MNCSAMKPEISKVVETFDAFRNFHVFHVNLNSSACLGINKARTSSITLFNSSNTVQIHF